MVNKYEHITKEATAGMQERMVPTGGVLFPMMDEEAKVLEVQRKQPSVVEVMQNVFAGCIGVMKRKEDKYKEEDDTLAKFKREAAFFKIGKEQVAMHLVMKHISTLVAAAEKRTRGDHVPLDIVRGATRDVINYMVLLEMLWEDM